MTTRSPELPKFWHQVIMQCADQPHIHTNIQAFSLKVIAARVKRNDEAMEQQKELHQLVVQRERLQIRILEEQLAKQTEDHSLKLERDREVRARGRDIMMKNFQISNSSFQLHDLKLRQEQEFHIQRLRHEQEIHQMRLAEYNKMQLASYHTAIG